MNEQHDRRHLSLAVRPAAFGRVGVARGVLRVAAALCAFGVASAAVKPAKAYCRTRTCEFRRDPSACATDATTGCSTRGNYVFWSDACIPFAIQRDGSVLDDISAATLEALVEDGFRTWSDVQCGAGTPEVAAGSQGPIACDAVEYDCKDTGANSNVIMFRDAFEDTRLGLRFGVIALTTLSANLTTGELFDADIEINSRDEDFSLEPGDGGETALRDLRGVVNHELGHLLGLSHSRVQGALMREAYEGTVEPHADDIEAMCEALGASDTDPLCVSAELGADAGCVGSDLSCTISRTEVEPRGCACRQAGAAPASQEKGWGAALALGLLLAGRLRGSRRARRVL